MSSPEPLLVLFDNDCALCRRMAAHAMGHAPRYFQFVAWQEYAKMAAAQTRFSREVLEAPPSKLRVLRGDTVLEDAAAWEVILEHYPAFSTLSWMAKKMGLTQTTAHAFHRTSRVLRRLCWRCGGSRYGRTGR